MKMVYLNTDYCTEFIILLVMVGITLLPTIWSLIIFNFPLVFKISLLFDEIDEQFSQLKHVYTIILYAP